MTIELEDFRPIRKFDDIKTSTSLTYYFVFGDEYEPRYRSMTVTKEIYDIADHNFFQVKEFILIKAHIISEPFSIASINGATFEGVRDRLIHEEWTENCFTFRTDRWNLSETGTEPLSSNNLIFTDPLDAGAFVIWLREQRGSE